MLTIMSVLSFLVIFTNVRSHNFNLTLISVKLRISDFPPIFNSPINARSVAVFNSTESLSFFEKLFTHLTQTPSKIYTEIRPSTTLEFILFLNVVAAHIHNTLWTPCILLHWPEIVSSSTMAESIILKIVNTIDQNDFPLNSEIYVGFETSSYHQNDNSSETVIHCDLFKYKVDITATSQFCHVRHLTERLSVSEGYFSYNPVSTTRRDLNGTTLNIIAQYDQNYEERISMLDFENGTVKYTGGMCFDLLLALEIAMNFSYIPMKGNGWVGLLPNGSWAGMVAQLINNEADISIAQASMIMMINTLSGISFLHPSSEGQFIALFKQPSRSSSADLIISAFSANSWICYFLTWAIIVVSIHFVNYFIRSCTNGSLNSNDDAFTKEKIIWAFSFACGKGWYIVPTKIYFRAIFLGASTMAFCIYAAYSSQLTVILVTENLPIKNFKELALSNLEIFTDKWLPVARSLIEKVYRQRGVHIPLKNSELYTVDAGLSRVIRDKSSVAFVTFADAANSVYYKMNITDKSDKYFCDTISTVTVASQRSPAAMFVKRASPLKEILNYNIIRLIEKGILRRLNSRYEDRTEILCRPKPHNYRGGLSLSDVRTPLFLLTAGFILCILNLILEHLCSRSVTKFDK